MKSCPTCNKTYTEQNLSFCIDDGTPLVASTEDESGSAAANRGPDPGEWRPPAYQPPGSYVPPGPGRRQKVWPWVVAILAVLLIGVVGLGIAAAILIPRMLRARPNRNSANYNANIESNENFNSSLNANSLESNSNLDSKNTNDQRNEDESPSPPTNEEQVLAELRDLEHEWTVANINADKKKLDSILADDYVGTSSDGKRQGKADYLRTIERDTVTQKWEFEDLKLSLAGPRATLNGIVRFTARDQEVAYRFTDKFVWRDGRWQATSSEVSQIQ